MKMDKSFVIVRGLYIKYNIFCQALYISDVIVLKKKHSFLCHSLSTNIHQQYFFTIGTEYMNVQVTNT